MNVGFPKQPAAPRDGSRQRPRSVQSCGVKTANIQNVGSAKKSFGGQILNGTFDSWQPVAGDRDDFVGTWQGHFKTNKSPLDSTEGIQNDFCFFRGSNDSSEVTKNFAAVADATCFMPAGSCGLDSKDDLPVESKSLSAHPEPASKVSEHSKKSTVLPESAIHFFSNKSYCNEDGSFDEARSSLGFGPFESASIMQSASLRCKSVDLFRRQIQPPPEGSKMNRQRWNCVSQKVRNPGNVVDVGAVLNSQDSSVAVDIATTDPLCANYSMMSACPPSRPQESDAVMSSGDAQKLEGFRHAAEEAAAEPVAGIEAAAEPVAGIDTSVAEAHVCHAMDPSAPEEDVGANTTMIIPPKLAPLWLVRSKRRFVPQRNEPQAKPGNSEIQS